MGTNVCDLGWPEAWVLGCCSWVHGAFRQRGIVNTGKDAARLGSASAAPEAAAALAACNIWLICLLLLSPAAWSGGLPELAPYAGSTRMASSQYSLLSTSW